MAAPAMPATPLLRARRFSLRFQSSQRIPGAQVRLELPPSLRLLWPASSVVWSGELMPQTPVDISFSLGEVRGGEKITVRVEQKVAAAQSKTLETQWLTLPAAF